MGKHHILTSAHAPKQMLEVMVFAHHEDSADLCATDVKEIVYTSRMELVLHHESGCVHYQYSYMLVKKEEPSLYDQTMIGRLNLFQKYYHLQTQHNALKD